jgi:hypothetical protein
MSPGCHMWQRQVVVEVLHTEACCQQSTCCGEAVLAEDFWYLLV